MKKKGTPTKNHCLHETRRTWFVSAFEVSSVVLLRLNGFLDTIQTFTCTSVKSRRDWVQRKVKTSKMLEILELGWDERNLVLTNIEDGQSGAKGQFSGQFTDLIAVGLKFVKKSATTNLSRKGSELVITDVKLGKGHDKTDLRRNLSQSVAAEIKNVECRETTKTTRKGSETIGRQVKLTQATHLADLGWKLTDLIVEKIQCHNVGKSTNGSRKSGNFVAAKINLCHTSRKLVDIFNVLKTDTTEIQASSSVLLQSLKFR